MAIDDLAIETAVSLKGLGLRQYLRSEREPFVRHFCHKLWGYALGRPVLATQSSVRTMYAALVAEDYRFSVAMQTIVQSQQFLRRRDQ